MNIRMNKGETQTFIEKAIPKSLMEGMEISTISLSYSGELEIIIYPKEEEKEKNA